VGQDTVKIEADGQHAYAADALGEAVSGHNLDDAKKFQQNIARVENSIVSLRFKLVNNMLEFIMML